MTCPNFSKLRFRYLLFSGNILGEFMYITRCTRKPLNLRAKYFQIAINDETKQIILGNVSIERRLRLDNKHSK